MFWTRETDITILVVLVIWTLFIFGLGLLVGAIFL